MKLNNTGHKVYKRARIAGHTEKFAFQWFNSCYTPFVPSLLLAANECHGIMANFRWITCGVGRINVRRDVRLELNYICEQERPKHIRRPIRDNLSTNRTA